MTRIRTQVLMVASPTIPIYLSEFHIFSQRRGKLLRAFFSVIQFAFKLMSLIRLGMTSSQQTVLLVKILSDVRSEV